MRKNNKQVSVFNGCAIAEMQCQQEFQEEQKKIVFAIEHWLCGFDETIGNYNNELSFVNPIFFFTGTYFSLYQQTKEYGRKENKSH